MGWITGFEPATSGATVRRSNQLSYIHHAETDISRLTRTSALRTKDQADSSLQRDDKFYSLSRGDVFDIEQLAALDAGLEELDVVGALSLGFVHQLVGALNQLVGDPPGALRRSVMPPSRRHTTPTSTRTGRAASR